MKSASVRSREKLKPANCSPWLVTGIIVFFRYSLRAPALGIRVGHAGCARVRGLLFNATACCAAGFEDDESASHVVTDCYPWRRYVLPAEILMWETVVVRFRHEVHLFFNATERPMHRAITYRGFEIHVELIPSAEDLYEVTFQIKGGPSLSVIGDPGRRVLLRHGPYTRRWAYLIAEVAGQAAIDLLRGPEDADCDLAGGCGRRA